MKLEMENIHRRVIYPQSKWWMEDEDTLVQTLPRYIMESVGTKESGELEKRIKPFKATEPTLAPGDNIRLDGTQYHVIRMNLYGITGGPKLDQEQGFVYQIHRGRYTPSKWQEIGEVKKQVEE